MLMQELYRISTNDTWVTIITGGNVFTPKYNGLLTDIPVSLLDTNIRTLSAIDLNHLLIQIA